MPIYASASRVAKLCVLSAVAVVLALAPAASASLTTVSTGGELSHQAIFEEGYGLGAGALAGFNPNFDGTQVFNVGSDEWTFTRAQDNDVAGIMEVCLPNLDGVSDQVWKDGLANFQARGRVAGYPQSFGYDAGAGYQNLLSVSGSGVNPSFNGGGDVDLSGLIWSFERADSPAGVGHRRSSMESRNNGLDYMVTYLVTGPDAGLSGWSWWLFWEDFDRLGDADYNDLVVEVYCVPAPAAAILGLLGLGAVAWLRRSLA